MSDTESLSSSSNTTVEDLPVETVIANLKSAVSESIDSGDYLSYSTMVDIYLADPMRFSYDEREQVLQTLLDILNENPKLTYEIGWDLPSVLLPYFESSSYDFSAPIRDGPGTYKVLKTFECLSKFGNPKELFLKGCELLSELRISDVAASDLDEVKERFFDLKFYSILELINSCMKKIETLYPSRFLSMFTAAFTNCIHVNFRDYTPHNMEFIFKRLYSTTRNYEAPPLPKHTLTEAELKKVVDDENYLQRKLLTGLLTNTVFIVGRNYNPNHSVIYFSNLSNKPFNFDNNIVVLDRLYELCFSFDIDVDAIFTDLIISSHTIFHKFDLNKPEDEVVGDIFEALVVDYQKNLLTSIVKQDAKEIQVNTLGTLVYHIHKIVSSNKVEKNHFPVNVTFHDALVLTLRLTIPSMVNPVFSNTAIQDMVVFWSWYSIEKSSYDNKMLCTEISAIPKVLLVTYFQCLLYIITSSPQIGDKDFRYIVLTLLTRVLILSPEQIGYDFIKDCLIHCSYSNVKVAMVGILKELLTKDKAGNKVDGSKKPEDKIEAEQSKEDKVTGQLDGLSLNKKIPPPLPTRDVDECNKYMSLTEERFNDIIKFVNDYITSSFVEISQGSDSETETETEAATSSYKINHQELSVLSVALNLLVAIKNYDTTLKNSDQIKAITDSVSKILNRCKEQYKESEAEINILGMLSITLDRINM